MSQIFKMLFETEEINIFDIFSTCSYKKASYPFTIRFPDLRPRVQRKDLGLCSQFPGVSLVLDIEV